MVPSRHIIAFAVAALMICASIAQGGQIVSKLTHPDHPKLPKNVGLVDCFGYEFTPATIETVTEKTRLHLHVWPLILKRAKRRSFVRQRLLRYQYARSFHPVKSSGFHQFTLTITQKNLFKAFSAH